MMSQSHPQKEDAMRLAEEEAGWAQQASQGDPDAFAKLHERYVDSVYNYFYTKVCSAFEAEELTSETFYRAIEALVHRRNTGQVKHFRPWLFKIATRVFQEYRGRLAKTPDSDRLGNALGNDEPLDEEEDALWQLVYELPDIERRILIMRHKHKLSYAEIARHLNCSVKACKQLHYQALTKLKRVMQQPGLWSETTRSENGQAIQEYSEHSVGDEELVAGGIFTLLTTCLTNSYVEKALEDLSLVERSCLLLHADAQFSEADIAEILNIDEEAVCSHLRAGSQHWLRAYNSLVEEELNISSNSMAVSHDEDFLRVERLISSSHHWSIDTRHIDENVGSAVN